VTQEQIKIRPMTVQDIPIGMRLKDLAGWNQTNKDWERFLSLAPDGCFVAELGGEPVGTVVTVIFEGSCGWVAMVLVPPEHRRKGIGTAMLHHGIEHLKSSGVDTIKLDATPVGREVYLPLGFVDEYGVERWEGSGQPFEVDGVSTILESDLPEVIAYDTPIYGLSRGDLVRRLHTDAQGICGLVRDKAGMVIGYALTRPGSSASQIGPVLADTREIGQSLIQWSLDRLSGGSVFFDVPLVNQHGVAIARSCGFTVQRQFTRMYFGEEPFSGRPSLVYATSGPEKG
jgi:GNAT superfamily N-acetyltransferase